LTRPEHLQPTDRMSHLPTRFRELPSIRHLLLPGAIVLWALVTAPVAVFLMTTAGRPLAISALVAAPIAFLVRRRPLVSAAILVAGATVLRLSLIGLFSSDPIEVSQLASAVAFAGADPYAARYLDGLPYPYGPVGLVSYLGGVPAELIATIGVSAILAAHGAWISLALFNAWPQFLYMPVIGNNDFSVGFVTLFALVLLRSRPMIGMALLAIAIGIKPYAAAWLFPAGVFGGWLASLIGMAVLVVCWAPVLFIWGVPSFVRASAEAEQVRSGLAEVPSWSFADLPLVRWLAVPIAFAAVFVRSWRAMVLTGATVFVVFLGFAPRAPQPYVAFLLPIVGLAIESLPRSARATAQARSAAAR